MLISEVGRRVLFSLLLLAGACSYDRGEPPEEIRDAVRRELDIHPQATLVDVYKNFFQSRFGPGHLIESEDAARNYLRKELAEASAFEPVLFQPLGIDSAFYRVNLSLVRDGRLSEDDLVLAFVESANSVQPPTHGDWIEEWRSILAIIETMELNLIGHENDVQFLDSLLSEGNVVVHHSELFVEAYDPHYRIVARRFVREPVEDSSPRSFTIPRR